MRPCSLARRARRSRRGSAYLAAVALALLLTTVAMGAFLAASATQAGSHDEVDAGRATRAARSAVAWGLRVLNDDATYAGGTVPSKRTIASGSGSSTQSVTLESSSASVAADQLRPAVITATATFGRATRTLRQDALPWLAPYDAVGMPVACLGSMTIASGAKLDLHGESGVAGTLTISGNGQVDGSVTEIGRNVTDVVEALQRDADRASVPPASIVDMYIASGVVLPDIMTTTPMTRVLLSSRKNSLSGAVDEAGVYVLNCNGTSVTLSNFRCAGTLVVLDPGPGSTLQAPFVLEPAVRGYPALIVRGSLSIVGGSAQLDESSGINTNYNPQGTPWPYHGGSWDSNADDKYDSVLGGLVFATGDLRLSSVTMTGAIARGGIAISGGVDVEIDRWALATPGPGLSAARWRLRPGTRVESLP